MRWEWGESNNRERVTNAKKGEIPDRWHSSESWQRSREELRPLLKGRSLRGPFGRLRAGSEGPLFHGSAGIYGSAGIHGGTGHSRGARAFTAARAFVSFTRRSLWQNRDFSTTWSSQQRSGSHSLAALREGFRQRAKTAETAGIWSSLS
jgi:hypothetical protein